MTPSSSRRDVYGVITEKICEQIESGKLNWHKTWRLSEMPRNYASGKPYRGINVLLLMAGGYSSPYWLTFNQAREAGGTVRRGEHSSIVTFFKPIMEVKEDPSTGEERSIQVGALLRYYNVFSLEQCTGVPEKPVDQTNEKIPSGEELIQSLKDLVIKHGYPSYYPRRDEISMPNLNEFEANSAYYATLYHEMTHWTGHPSRLGRASIIRFIEGGGGCFGDDTYGQEELVAELGSSFLCTRTGIDLDDGGSNAAAYMQGWLSHLRENTSLIVRASGQAQRAADYLLKGVTS